MELHQINRKDIRKFGITLGIILIIIGSVQLLKGNVRIYPWFYAVGILNFVLGLFIPAILKPFHFVFAKITQIIGQLIAGFLLIIVFYIILTPIGLIARLFGKDFLDINWKREPGTYWIKKEQPSLGIERYEKQF